MNDRPDIMQAALCLRMSSDRQDAELSDSAQLRALREGYFVPTDDDRILKRLDDGEVVGFVIHDMSMLREPSPVEFELAFDVPDDDVADVTVREAAVRLGVSGLREPNPWKGLPVCARLSTLRNLLEQACEERGLSGFHIDVSWGKGEWNPNPWIAFLDPRITKTTRTGFYPVFLFRSDGSGFYLSIDLGTGRQYGKPSRAEISRLNHRAEHLSPYFEKLEAQGLSRALPMDLLTEKG